MATYKASTYQSPDFDLNKYSKGFDDSYYKQAMQQYATQANKDRATQLADAQKTQQANLKTAYVNRMQNERKMNQNLAMQGIRGGMTETANLNLANQYGQARASANSDYANSVNTINQNIDRNIFDYNMDMGSRMEQDKQNYANARWQADREDRANEVARQTEYWSTYYINKYSGFDKKQLKKAEKDIKAKLKSTTDPLKRIQYEQALAGIGARRGVIATSK